MKKSKKILFVSHEPYINGASKSMLSMINGIVKICGDSINITVMTPWEFKKDTSASILFKSNEIKCKQMLYRDDYKYKNKRTSIKKYIYDVWNYMAVVRLSYYIKKNEFDIVCSNSSAVDIGARAALLANIPHIYYIREFMEEDFGFEFRNKKRMIKLLNESDCVIFISKAIEKKYQQLYQLKKTAQFYNGFILEDYYVKNHDILKDEEISLVQVGRYEEGKGTINTIELLYELKQSHIFNWNMEFIGEGDIEYVNLMRKLIVKYQMESQITISGFCSDIKKKLAQKDILIMNSRAEGFGRVTVEGMLARCLVIGRNKGGTTEIIKNEVNGITFERDEDFVHAIHLIVADKEKYRGIAKEGQTYAMDNFNYIRTAQNFMNVVKDCLQ